MPYQIIIGGEEPLIVVEVGGVMGPVNPSGGGTWGSITGTLTDQTDLNNALGGKAASSHQHALGDLTASGAANGQVAKWNGAAWEPADEAGSAVDNAAVNAAIATNPAATRAAAKVAAFASDLGAYGHNLRAAFTSLDTALSRNNNAELVVIGDSTANGTNEWFELFADHVRARYPNHRHIRRIINMTTNNWDETILNAGTEAYLNFPTGYPNTYSAWDSVPGFVGNYPFSLTIKLRIDNLTDFSAGTKALISRWLASDKRQWKLGLEPGQKVRFYWWDAAVTQKNLITTAALPALDGQDFWLQVYWTPDNGAGQSQMTVRTRVGDTGAFTVLETVVGTFGTSSLRTVAQFDPVTLGAPSVASPLRIYTAWVHEGDAGKIISPYFVSGATGNPIYSPFYVGTGTIITSNHSRSGNTSSQLVSQLTGAESVDRMYADTENCVVFVNLGLNDTGVTMNQFVSNLQQIVALHNARCPSAFYAIVGQNPNNTTATHDVQHVARMSRAMRWAAKEGYGVVDFHAAMLGDGRPLSSLLDSGLIHPNAVANAEILAPVLTSNWPK